MEELLAGLRAAGEETRVRILFALAQGEFNVSELTQILNQSQPRVSRHLKLMVEAGLISRHKEGNWVLFRLREEGALARVIVGLLPKSDPELARDMARLEEVRRQRAEIASEYFRANAPRWEELRSLHVSEEDVDKAMLRLAGDAPIAMHLDLGTGTGGVLRTFAGIAGQAVGIDASRDMLAVARLNLPKSAHVRQGDIYALPFADGFSDFITIHQVLHFLDDPGRALTEAARVLKPSGRMLIADFAPHDMEKLREQHAHRRLGISSEHLMAWLARAGAKVTRHEVLPPPWRKDEMGLTVSLWLAERLAS